MLRNTAEWNLSGVQDSYVLLVAMGYLGLGLR